MVCQLVVSVKGCLPCPEYFVQAAALGISCVAEGIQQNPTDGEWHHVVEDSQLGALGEIDDRRADFLIEKAQRGVRVGFLMFMETREDRK